MTGTASLLRPHLPGQRAKKAQSVFLSAPAGAVGVDGSKRLQTLLVLNTAQRADGEALRRREHLQGESPLEGSRTSKKPGEISPGFFGSQHMWKIEKGMKVCAGVTAGARQVTECAGKAGRRLK